jgi:hypothetical protein
MAGRSPRTGKDHAAVLVLSPMTMRGFRVASLTLVYTKQECPPRLVMHIVRTQ